MQYLLTQEEYRLLRMPKFDPNFVTVTNILYAIVGITDKKKQLVLFQDFTNDLCLAQQDGKVKECLDKWTQKAKTT